MPNACDACSIRKVRCNGEYPCLNCISNNLDCTNVRVKKKPGPNRLKKKTIEAIKNLKKNELYINELDATFSTLFVKCLQAYENHFYAKWPVIHHSMLLEVLNKSPMSLKYEDPSLYALFCSLCAVISKRIGMVCSSEEIHLDEEPEAVGKMFLKEVLEVRYTLDNQVDENPNSILTSFFLYEYYLHLNNGYSRAILYLREAITMINILQLQDEASYETLLKDERHRTRKIYYLVYITEFFFYVKNKLPRLLEENVTLPIIIDETCPQPAINFHKLVEIFYICSSLFRNKLSFKNNCIIENIFDDNGLNSYGNLTRIPIQIADEITHVQERLENIELLTSSDPSQAVNTFVSKHWARALIWQTFSTGNMNDYNEKHSYLSKYYPIEIAHDFLSTASKFPDKAYISEGAYVKIIDIINSLADVIESGDLQEFRFAEKIAREYFSSLTDFILRIKSSDINPEQEFLNNFEVFNITIPKSIEVSTNVNVLTEFSPIESIP